MPVNNVSDICPIRGAKAKHQKLVIGAIIRRALSAKRNRTLTTISAKSEPSGGKTRSQSICS
jgi:hypothetical protein